MFVNTGLEGKSVLRYMERATAWGESQRSWEFESEPKVIEGHMGIEKLSHYGLQFFAVMFCVPLYLTIYLWSMASVFGDL